MYLATYCHPHGWDWIAVGDSKEGALALFKKNWERYSQNGLVSDTWEQIEPWVIVRFTRVGDVWCDGELLHSHDHPQGFTNSDFWKERENV